MAKQTKYEFIIGGEKRILDFGMYFWEIFCEKMNIGPDNLLTVFTGASTFKSMRLMTYCGIISNDFLNGIPDSVTEAEVAKMLNDNPEVMSEIFTKGMSVFYGGGETEKKRKVSPSRSKKSKK